MEILTRASLLHVLLLFMVNFSQNNFVQGAVGLYGPDRYEGLPETCLQPMDFGYCRAKLQRYYFDIRRMKCTMFYWGGCAGNDNNFKTMDECNDYCSAGYEQSNSIVPLKRERSENNPNSNTNSNARSSNFNSRGNTAVNTSKSTAPKFTIKSSPAPSYRDNASANNGTARANVKTFNINPPQKELKYPTATDDLEDEEYDE